MTISKLEADMKKYLGGASWINRKELAGYLGCDRSSAAVADAVKGCAKINSRYFVGDICQNIHSMIGRKKDEV